MSTAPRCRPLLLLLALVAFPSAVHAHRLDEYLQATLVVIEPGDLQLRLNLMPGVDVAGQVLALVDRDGDGVISPGEAAGYAELLRGDLLVRMDGRDLGLKLTGSNFFTPAEIRTGSGIIQLEFSVTTGSLAVGEHRLTIENRHLSAISVYLLNAAKPKSDSVEITAQTRNENQSLGEMAFTLHSPGRP